MNHPNDDQLETYARGRLPEAELAGLEEHLLVCAACQKALETHDIYLRAMRAALRHPPEEVPAASGTAGWFSGRRGFAWAGALAAIVLVFLAIPWESAPPVPVAVTLSSFRGAEAVKMARAPAGSPLELGIDSVEATPECRIEIVNAVGEPAWNGGLVATTKGLEARVEKGLSAGQYWVRLYGPDSRLLQEFGLRLD